MADHHDTTHSTQGGGFWGCATIFLAIIIAAFAGIAGAALIFGGINRKPKDATPEAPPAAAAPAAATPGAAAPTATPPETVTQAPPAAPAVLNPNLPVLEVTMKPAAENAMLFDRTLITAKVGQKVKITYINQHALSPMQHNLLICKPGSKQRIIDAATAMMTDLPKWLAKDLIPESSDVLYHTKLLSPGQTGVIEFVAGPEGDYPYICTFPGHSLLMQGTLRVEKAE